MTIRIYLKDAKLPPPVFRERLFGVRVKAREPVGEGFRRKAEAHRFALPVGDQISPGEQFVDDIAGLALLEPGQLPRLNAVQIALREQAAQDVEASFGEAPFDRGETPTRPCFH